MDASGVRRRAWLPLACLLLAGVAAVLTVLQCDMVTRADHHAGADHHGNTIAAATAGAHHSAPPAPADGSAAQTAAGQPVVMAALEHCLRQVQDVIQPSRSDIAVRLWLLAAAAVFLSAVTLGSAASVVFSRGPPGAGLRSGRVLLTDFCINRC